MAEPNPSNALPLSPPATAIRLLQSAKLADLAAGRDGLDVDDCSDDLEHGPGSVHEADRVDQNAWVARPCSGGPPNFELQQTKAPCRQLGTSAYAGPRPAVVNSNDGRGPAVVLLGDFNGAFAAELVVR